MKKQAVAKKPKQTLEVLVKDLDKALDLKAMGSTGISYWCVTDCGCSEEA